MPGPRVFYRSIWAIGPISHRSCHSRHVRGWKPRRPRKAAIQMLSYLRKLIRNGRDRGASAVEYGLMVAAIAAVIVGIVFGLGTLVHNTFSNTSSCIAAGSTTA